jgi:hypothetical protein
MDMDMERDPLIQHLHMDTVIMEDTTAILDTTGTMERDQLKLYPRQHMDTDTMAVMGTMVDIIMERGQLRPYQRLHMDMDIMEGTDTMEDIITVRDLLKLFQLLHMDITDITVDSMVIVTDFIMVKRSNKF